MGIITAIILIGIINPIVLKNKTENWEEELNEKIETIELKILTEFQKIQSNLLNNLAHQKEYIKSIDPQLLKTTGSNLFTNDNTQFVFALLDSGKNLISWHYSSILDNSNLIDEYFVPRENYFISNSLVDYISAYDTLNFSFGQYYLAIFQPIEKKYKIENIYFEPVQLSNIFSQEFNTEVEFNLFKEAQPSRDGRKHSFALLNSNNNKIGTVTFLKPTRENEFDKIAANFNLAQSISSLLLIIVIGLLIVKYLLRIKSNLIKFFLLGGYLILFRYAILYLELSSLFKGQAITNSKYFSSLFGGGIAGSPLELFISLIIIAVIVYIAFRYSIEYYKRDTDRNLKLRLQFIFSLLVFMPFYFLTLRSLGASVKSIVLDSSLRYYKEGSLLPSSIEVFMLFNILLLGIIIFVISITYLIVIFRNVKDHPNFISYFISIFFLFQIIGLLYDLIQREPQGTPLFRIIFILFTFIALFSFVKLKFVGVREHFVYAVLSSILVILLLTQYNSLVERDSLRKTAYNLTRQNEELLKFAVQETLVRAITDRETVQSFYLNNTNSSSIAFKLWSNSILQKETLGSAVSLLDRNHNKVGSFEFRFSNEFNIDWDKYSTELSDLHEIKIFEEDLLFSDNKIIRGIASIEDVEGVIGYITVSVMYDLSSLNVPDAPDFMIADNSYINDTIDFEKLKIYDFHQGTLINTISNYNLNENEIISILDAPYNEYGEAWLNLNLNNERHFVFVLKREQNSISRVISVALKEKELSWGLFDFFKVFFVHILIIISIFIVYLFYFFSRNRSLKLTFTQKLLISFVGISLVPLILVSVFFRSLTTSKNDTSIEYKLGKRASSLENYLETYTQTSNLKLEAIAAKATTDLGIDFTLYKTNEYIYSSNDQYYEVGLIPKVINPVAFQSLFLAGLNDVVVKESIEKFSFNSIYYKTSLLGEYHVIKIDDGFNKIVVPLAGEEVDVYIFISYSVAMIIILIMGFILSGQISKPITQLKNATRSIALGDLNIELKIKRDDEVGELVQGFNYMVKELGRNQAELAEFERETAWKEMAKQVAHEIKNPLTPMKLSVQQLITAYNDKSPKFDDLFQKVTQTIVNQIEALKNIASEFSVFTRMPNPKFEMLYLDELLFEATNLFVDENINFIHQVDHCKIEADKDQLRRVFINLIRNSIQAETKQIIVQTRTIENFVVLTFEDNGIGIDKKNIAKIFDANFSTKQSGMGIGLSMAKKTVENMNGEIRLKETSSSGTIFEIKLPLG